MAVTNALIKAGSNALTKGAEKAVEKATTKAISKVATETANKAITKAVTRGLTGAGVSSLAPKAGSTLDGIIGRSSGLVLPEPKINTKTLAQYGKEAMGKEYSSVGEVMDDMGLKLSDLKDNLSRKNYGIVKSGAKEAAAINNPIEEMTATGIRAKSQLPMLNRQQYYEDTLGKVGQNNVRYEDVPKSMQRYLSDKVPRQNDSTLSELFGEYAKDGDTSMSDLYDRFQSIAEGPNSNLIYTPENIDAGIAMEGRRGDAITQDFADRAFGGKRDIPVSSSSSGAKNVKVSRPTSTAGVEEAVAETPKTTNVDLANQIAELRSQIGSTGAGGAGMGGGRSGGGTATQLPGSEGFNVKLKTGDTTNVRVAPEATGSTKQQRAVRKLDDMTAKSMNASAKQYRGLVGKSGSIDGHYKTVAERMRAEKIDQANVAEKAQSALSLREDIKQQGLAYAEANGVTLNLAGIDNTIGLSATQKRKLSELGLGLDEMLGGSGVVTPTQAEDIYKTLRDYAYNWSDSKDALTKMAGNACEKEANAVRDMIDKTMDNINVDYKTSLLENAAKNGEDPAYLRKLAGKSDFKFSDLRKDQSDWIAINDLAGNKIKNEPTLNVFGVDTGMPNPLSAGAERLKEKIYERQAYGAGRGGNNSGGGSVPPLGGSGAENNINFETIGDRRAGTLGSLLGRAKGAGLIGAGVLGGLVLGGGGSGGSNNAGSLSSLSYGAGTADTASSEPEIDPYSTMTIGGYTYDQLENGYTAAVMAGDTDAAKLIANMIGMLDDKIERYNSTVEKNSDSSGIAAKQRAALNVLSGLMQNYSAQGPVGGRFTQFMNALTGGGYNPNTAAYDSGAKGSMGSIIKALGDTGALSEGDQKRALELLPNTQDSPQAAEMKYQQLVQILQGAGAQ